MSVKKGFTGMEKAPHISHSRAAPGQPRKSLAAVTASMALQWQDIRDDVLAGRLPLIDLRSPHEYEVGHIPQGINVPLLDNQERAHIGTLYKQQGKLLATQEGLEIFARKGEAFRQQLEGLGAGSTRICVYCWRGGMRSRLVAMWLASMGFEVALLAGGYKAYRRQVLQNLSALAAHPLLVLNGRTGSGKTDLVTTLAGEGLPVLDFEGLAHHRGSAFGGLGQKKLCPSQQNFENHLIEAYWPFRDRPLILVEIESFIGPIALSKALRLAIVASPMVFVERDFADRVARLVATYAPSWNEEDDVHFSEQLKLLRRFLTGDEYRAIETAVRERRFAEVVTVLLEQRYDRAYDKSLRRREAQVIARFNLSHEEGKACAFLRQALLHGLRTPA